MSKENFTIEPGNEICKEYHTTVIDSFKLETSQKLDLLINKVSKNE